MTAQKAVQRALRLLATHQEQEVPLTRTHLQDADVHLTLQAAEEAEFEERAVSIPLDIDDIVISDPAMTFHDLALEAGAHGAELRLKLIDIHIWDTEDFPAPGETRSRDRAVRV